MVTSSSPKSAVDVAVAASGPNQMDRLSKLPNELLISIISLLPTHIAARTSVLSRHFRHLWEASPSLDLVSRHKSYNDLDLFHECRIFFDMASCAFLCRDPFLNLPCLRLLFPAPIPHGYHQFTASAVTAFLRMAHSYGLRHLTIQNFRSFLCIAHVIFSIDTLTSLSLDCLPDALTLQKFDFLSGITLTHLTSLSLCLSTPDLPVLNQLLPRLSSLQDLQLSLGPSYTTPLNLNSSFTFALSALTINKLKLVVSADCTNLTSYLSFFLSLPSLETFNWVYDGQYIHAFHFHGEFPLLKTAVITLYDLHEHNVTGVASLFTCISHVEQLSLHAKESWDERHPTLTLLRAAEVASDFPNLKNLDATLCCHEHNIRAIVKILTKSPAIESLKLVHEFPGIIGWIRGRERLKGIYHKNLHLGQKKKELINFLSEMCMSKKAPKDWELWSPFE